MTGEWRDSFRIRTGEEVREGMDRGGGEENFLHRRGDLSFMCSEPRLFWLVAKKSSKDLRRGGGEKRDMRSGVTNLSKPERFLTGTRSQKELPLHSPNVMLSQPFVIDYY